jgi:quercetin dioxygenase-like cupin family protein
MTNKLMENAYPCHVPDRLMDASLLSFDLPALIEKIKQEGAWKKGQRNAITLLKSSCMRIVLIALHKHSEINFKHSGNLLSIQLIEGSANFNTGNNSILLKKGSLLTFHKNLNHNLISLEESVLLLTISTDPEDQT